VDPLLNLTTQDRNFLNYVEALGIDALGHEILLGLSHGESNSFLQYQAHKAMAKANAPAYSCMVDRHLVARRLKISTSRRPPR
jgi:kynurenine formamidase